MNLEESEEMLRMQEKEKLYSGMKVDQLMEIAREQNVDTKGEKSVLVKRLVDKAAGKKRTSNQILLEEAIMSWSSTDMKGYLLDMGKPQWGSKATMTERIMNHISIDDAVDINKEYKVYLAATTDKIDKGNGGSKGGKEKSKKMDAEERKRKREEEESKKEEGGEESEEETDKMEIEETGVEEEKETKKKYVPRRRRAEEEEDEVVVSKVVPLVAKDKETPPKIVFGKTSDKDTDFSASARGGQ